MTLPLASMRSLRLLLPCLPRNSWKKPSCNYSNTSLASCKNPERSLFHLNKLFQQQLNLNSCNQDYPKTYIDVNVAESNKKSIRDPILDHIAKEIFVPSIASNMIKVYQDNPLEVNKIIIEPLSNLIEISEAPMPGREERKEAVHMLVVRRRKMRKHRLERWRKKYHLSIVRRKMRRALRKEQAFRTELLSQVEEADNFNAREYVTGVIHKLQCHPKPPTRAELREHYRTLKKKNKHTTTFITPNFDV